MDEKFEYSADDKHRFVIEEYRIANENLRSIEGGRRNLELSAIAGAALVYGTLLGLSSTSTNVHAPLFVWLATFLLLWMAAIQCWRYLAAANRHRRYLRRIEELFHPSDDVLTGYHRMSAARVLIPKLAPVYYACAWLVLLGFGGWITVVYSGLLNWIHL